MIILQIINQSEILDYLQNSAMNLVLTITSISTKEAHERHLHSGIISKHSFKYSYDNIIFTKCELICLSKIILWLCLLGNGVVDEEKDHQEAL